MSSPEISKPTPAEIEFRRRGPDALVAILSGEWKAAGGLPRPEQVQDELKRSAAIRHVTCDVSRVTQWDSGLIGFLLQCQKLCEEAKVKFDQQSLPQGMGRLIALALAVPEREGAKRGRQDESFVQHVGMGAIRLSDALRLNVSFIGECVISFAKLIHGLRAFRWNDAALLMQRCGAEALPIVALIGFLMGAILAFVGSVQLAQFGATIYVADMVGVAMAREMGCMMTGIIICGRTGAAYAAELGTMKVTQELDAFRTFGIPVVDFLVTPRILALVLMLPLLTLFAIFVGIGGGFFVAMLMLEIHPTEYWVQTVAALPVRHLFLGVGKSLVFGALIGITACYRGLQCGSDAAAVGRATTTAVVAGITWLIVADAIFAVVSTVLHF
jgi:phospholipid/cholesterol/gamma-HCH transport system permease protein